jgi:hypothetical protein
MMRAPLTARHAPPSTRLSRGRPRPRRAPAEAPPPGGRLVRVPGPLLAAPSPVCPPVARPGARLSTPRPIVAGGLCSGGPARPHGTTPRLRCVARAPPVRSTRPAAPPRTVTPWRFPCPSAPRPPGRRRALPCLTACTAHTLGLSRAVHRVGSMRLILIEASPSAYPSGMLAVGKSR